MDGRAAGATLASIWVFLSKWLSDIPAVRRGLISHDDASLNTNADIILVTFDTRRGAAFVHILFHKLPGSSYS